MRGGRGRERLREDCRDLGENLQSREAGREKVNLGGRDEGTEVFNEERKEGRKEGVKQAPGWMEGGNRLGGREERKGRGSKFRRGRERRNRGFYSERWCGKDLTRDGERKRERE